ITRSGNIHMVLARHEQGLVHEAEGYARATGKPGVCIVTSGPGATNTVTGIADARYDSIPLVVISGQVSQGLIGNDAFQELDFIGMTRGIVKWGITVRDRRDLGKYLKMAFYIATTGKPGPVILDIPKDVQVATGDPEYPNAVSIRGYKPKDEAHIGQLKKAFKLLKGAKRPLILAGGGIHISKAEKDLRLFAEAMQIPVVTTIMGKGSLPDNHPLYIGNSGMHGRFSANQAVLNCDVLFSIGSRFSDRITGNLDTYVNDAKIIHIDIDTAAIHKNVRVDIPIVADAKKALKKLKDWATEPIDTSAWMEEIKTWDREHPLVMPGKKNSLNPQTIMESINEVFPKGIVVSDVGQHQMWAAQFIEANENKRVIFSGGLGTMGFGFPAAIGA
ncbi:MAG: thiamine pyrophosphate-dependent enzyme, partial [Acidaminococcaceae bacterium]|nr:thiamine pyrophosphate-dependent enzyme [Acidaminococcaceae bacterium]